MSSLRGASGGHAAWQLQHPVSGIASAQDSDDDSGICRAVDEVQPCVKCKRKSARDCERENHLSCVYVIAPLRVSTDVCG